jgi:hypothetical protein
VRFEVAHAVGPFELCHCPRCRKASGSAFFAGLGVDVRDFRLVSGAELIRRYEAPIRECPPAYRVAFCSCCGSPVPDPPPGASWFEIPGPPGRRSVRPDKHLRRVQSPWFEITDVLPRLTKVELVGSRQKSSEPMRHAGSSSA